MESNQQPSTAPEPAPAPRHPLLRQLLIAGFQIALPLAEAFLEAWLASRGIKLPPVGQGIQNANSSDPVRSGAGAGVGPGDGIPAAGIPQPAPSDPAFAGWLARAKGRPDGSPSS